MWVRGGGWGRVQHTLSCWFYVTWCKIHPGDVFWFLLLYDYSCGFVLPDSDYNYSSSLCHLTLSFISNCADGCSYWVSVMESFAKKSEQSNGLIASAASSSKSSASASPAKAPSTQAAAAAAVQNPVPVSLVVSYYYSLWVPWGGCLRIRISVCMCISVQVSIHGQGARIAQLVEQSTKKPGVILMQIWVPVQQGIFLPVYFQCRLSYIVHNTAPMSHASTSALTLKNNNTGSHTIVWTHTNATHTDRNG